MKECVNLLRVDGCPLVWIMFHSCPLDLIEVLVEVYSKEERYYVYLANGGICIARLLASE